MYAPNIHNNQVRTRPNREFCPAVPHGWQDPSIWTIFHCLSRCSSRQLGWKGAAGTQTGSLTRDAGNTCRGLTPCTTCCLIWTCGIPTYDRVTNNCDHSQTLTLIQGPQRESSYLWDWLKAVHQPWQPGSSLSVRSAWWNRHVTFFFFAMKTTKK